MWAVSVDVVPVLRCLDLCMRCEFSWFRLQTVMPDRVLSAQVILAINLDEIVKLKPEGATTFDDLMAIADKKTEELFKSGAAQLMQLSAGSWCWVPAGWIAGFLGATALSPEQDVEVLVAPCIDDELLVETKRMVDRVSHCCSRGSALLSALLAHCFGVLRFVPQMQ